MYSGRCWCREQQTIIIWRKNRFYVFFSVTSKALSFPPAVSPTNAAGMQGWQCACSSSRGNGAQPCMCNIWYSAAPCSCSRQGCGLAMTGTDFPAEGAQCLSWALVSIRSGNGGEVRASHPPPGSLQTHKGSRKASSHVRDSKFAGLALEELQMLKNE